MKGDSLTSAIQEDGSNETDVLSLYVLERECLPLLELELSQYDIAIKVIVSDIQEQICADELSWMGFLSISYIAGSYSVDFIISDGDLAESFYYYRVQENAGVFMVVERRRWGRT